jgi:hypothetical protein
MMKSFLLSIYLHDLFQTVVHTFSKILHINTHCTQFVFLKTVELINPHAPDAVYSV